MEQDEEILKAKLGVIYTLHAKSYYNKRHPPIDFVCKKLAQIPCKKIKKAIKELRKEKTINIKPTYHGNDVSLNVKKKNEIDKYLKQTNSH